MATLQQRIETLAHHGHSRDAISAILGVSSAEVSAVASNPAATVTDPLAGLGGGGGGGGAGFVASHVNYAFASQHAPVGSLDFSTATVTGDGDFARVAVENGMLLLDKGYYIAMASLTPGGLNVDTGASWLTTATITDALGSASFPVGAVGRGFFDGTLQGEVVCTTVLGSGDADVHDFGFAAHGYLAVILQVAVQNLATGVSQDFADGPGNPTVAGNLYIVRVGAKE